MSASTAIFWYLIVISPWDNSSVIIPAPYPTKAACIEAAKQAEPIGHGFSAKGYCIPAALTDAKERTE